jgi:hypothetical protein
MESSLLPSRTRDRFWIQAWKPEAQNQSYPRVGKWIVTVDAEDIDAAWHEIQTALSKGKLGPSAKTRTAMRYPFTDPDGQLVICVYTADSEDTADKERVRRFLTNLGFQRMRYKTDEETRRNWHACGRSEAL